MHNRLHYAQHFISWKANIFFKGACVVIVIVIVLCSGIK